MDLRHILVTFGGSDPKTTLLKLHKPFAVKDLKLHIRVIIGPRLLICQTKQIENLVQDHENITLIYSPEALRDHYQWADFCVGASSASRYDRSLWRAYIFALFTQNISSLVKVSDIKQPNMQDMLMSLKRAMVEALLLLETLNLI